MTKTTGVNLIAAVEQSPVAIMLIDTEGYIEYVNPAYTLVTGYANEETLGVKVGWLDTDPVDRDTIEEMWKTIRSGETWRHEWQRRNKNNKPYWENISITPVKEDSGEVHHYLVIRKDISDRKKVDELRELNQSLQQRIEESTIQMETFFNVSLDMLGIAKENGYFIKLNEAWERILGFSKEEIMSAPFFDFIHPDDVQSTIEAMSILEMNLPLTNFTNRYRTKTGTYKHIEWRAVISGELIYAAARDVTERFEAETILKRTSQEADTANRAKSEFLSRMSHELRTPMNAILGFAQLLKMGTLTPQQTKSVGQILKSGNHLLGLINEVLDISKIEAGEISISMEPVPLTPIIHEMLDIVAIFAESRNVKVDLESPNNLIFVKADRQRLKQVLLNLLNNAIKYNIAGGAVAIRVEIKDSETDRKETIRISVIDTGKGISADLIPQLFTPFERIGAETTDTEGTGLGLAIVEKLMVAMNGSVGVESIVGKGSTFWVEFERDASSVEKQKAHVESLPVVITDHPHSTILYVEDNSSNIELMEQVIQTSRPSIHLINSVYGRQAITIAKENRPSLIFLDLNLPDMHGSDVLRELMLNSETSHIPVVVISADAMSRQRDALLAAGARDYLSKPLDINQLLKVIDHYITSGHE